MDSVFLYLTNILCWCTCGLFYSTYSQFCLLCIVFSETKGWIILCKTSTILPRTNHTAWLFRPVICLQFLTVLIQKMRHLYILLIVSCLFISLQKVIVGNLVLPMLFLLLKMLLQTDIYVSGVCMCFCSIYYDSMYAEINMTFLYVIRILGCLAGCECEWFSVSSSNSNNRQVCMTIR